MYGWERKGDYNEQSENPWIEGAWMTKRNGKYYLQYAAPGTEFKSYSDGLYVSEKPLGPFTLASHNPVSYKPEGFAASAGHSSTFQDKYGNYWHVSTMTISQKHMFERRLGFFPTFFDKDGEMYVYTGFGDFPFKVPTKKINSPTNYFRGGCCFLITSLLKCLLNCLIILRAMRLMKRYVRYWSAQTGNKGEWISIDLQKLCTVNAVQINYAENNMKLFGRADGYLLPIFTRVFDR